MEKKAHTVKNTIISDLNQWIHYVGATVSGGKTHDFQLLKNEFPSENNYFENCKVWLDSGYQGFKKIYTTEETHIPIKKPRKSKNNPTPSLNKEQKEHNKEVSKTRIIVENSICRMKKFNVLNYKLRNRIDSFADDIIELCAGLANFKIKCKMNPI